MDFGSEVGRPAADGICEPFLDPHLVLASLSDAVVVVDSEWRVVFANPMAGKIAGKPAGDSPGTTYWDEWPASRGTEIERQFRRAVRDQTSSHFEHRYKDELRDLWLDIKAEPYKQGLVISYRDISERKQTEERLLSLSRLSSGIAALLARDAEIVDTLQQAARLLVTNLQAAFVRIWILNQDENVLELLVSEGQYTHLDGPHGRVPVGKFKIGLIAQERRPHLTNSVVGDERVGDQEWARREGMVAFAGYPLLVGQRLEGVLALFSRTALTDSIHAMLSSISDGIAAFVERKVADREIRAVQDRNRQILQTITGAFFGVDREFNILYVNGKFEEITNRSAVALTGRNLWQQFPEMEGNIYQESFLEVLRTGRPSLFVACLPGFNLWTEMHVYPSEHGLSVYFQDITERKRIEQKLLDSAKLESLGVMAGGIAHDFNNLLTGILGNASLLTDISDDTLRGYAEDIVMAAERAAALTRQMLAFSGKGRFELHDVDLSKEVREILKLTAPMLSKDVQVELNLDGNLPLVHADAAQMQQVIMNLVINGAESIQGSQGRVIVTTHTSEIDATFISHMFSPHEISPGFYVCLEVQDTGCGMSEETKAKIFDPFFTTKFTGRGLGLAAVSGIVRGHKGALRVYSSPGTGTTFKVYLPAVAADRNRREIVSEPEPTARRGTILFVDDEEVVRRVGRATLRQSGFEVVLAATGKEAVTIFAARSAEIDAIILDMTMPVMGGEEALGLLRAIRPDVPVVVCSGYNEVEVIRRFTSQHIVAFIQKPFTAGALTRKVQSALTFKRQ